MFKHILIPTDGSDLSRKALLYGVQLAKESKAKVTALTIRQPYTVTAVDTFALVGSQEEFEMSSREIAERALEQAEMAGEAAGVAVDTAQEVNDQPYRAIIDSALANGCDLIVMASHGRRGVSALLLGSETSKVLTHSTIPVLVYR
jgi:nucleotide-binding universal stress UspA family protein